MGKHGGKPQPIKEPKPVPPTPDGTSPKPTRGK
jgi:hypothetical protein